jgi:hypothetical protein
VFVSLFLKGEVMTDKPIVDMDGVASCRTYTQAFVEKFSDYWVGPYRTYTHPRW